MWSDSEDLAVIADMFQIRIKVITTKGSNDKTPTENWIYPDLKLKQFAELKDVQMNDMVLLHENDVHFNLIISKDSDLALYGSLSHRFNVGPFEEEERYLDETSKEDEINEDAMNENEAADLKKELLKYKKSMASIEKEYFLCEQELKMKTEELEKCKVEIKDLKKIVDLRKQLNVKDDDITNMDVEEEYEINDLRRMKNMGFDRKCPQVEPVSRIEKEKLAEIKELFPCTVCDFTGLSKIQLRKHIHAKHPQNEKNSCETGRERE